MAHVAKYTRGALGHMFAHYERAKGKDNEYIKFGNENIDTSKSHLNYNLGPKRNISQGDFVKKRCNEVKCLNRKDVNVMCSWVITAPKDLDLKQQKKFFIESYKFLESRYGADNVISVYVHLDEVTPHMHFSFVPVIYDAKKDVLKVSAKQKISKSDLKSFHGDLQNHLDKVAIKCNILNEATRNGNKSIEELKRKTAIKEINEKKNYLNILICKIKEKEKELKYLSEKERKLSILLDEDIDKLEEQLKNLRENKE
ncbi:MAG: MobV family relaxase, partial [Clostridium sp.]